MILASLALLGAVSMQPAKAQGTWTSSLPVTPATAWLTKGVVIKASNLGPMSGSKVNIQSATISGITFDTVLTNVTVGNDASSWGSGYIPQNPPIMEYYYSGSDSSVSNLVNTWAWVHRWWDEDPDQNVYINFSDLVPGHAYQFQILVGIPWDYDGVNLYGPNGETMWFGAQPGQGKKIGMATFRWTATSASGQFNINLPKEKEVELFAYVLIDTSAGSSTASGQKTP